MNDPKAGIVAEKLAKRMFEPDVRMNGNEISRKAMKRAKSFGVGRGQ